MNDKTLQEIEKKLNAISKELIDAYTDESNDSIANAINDINYTIILIVSNWNGFTGDVPEGAFENNTKSIYRDIMAKITYIKYEINKMVEYGKNRI